jgi:hypothetical protein
MSVILLASTIYGPNPESEKKKNTHPSSSRINMNRTSIKFKQNPTIRPQFRYELRFSKVMLQAASGPRHGRPNSKMTQVHLNISIEIAPHQATKKNLKLLHSVRAHTVTTKVPLVSPKRRCNRRSRGGWRGPYPVGRLST